MQQKRLHFLVLQSLLGEQREKLSYQITSPICQGPVLGVMDRAGLSPICCSELFHHMGTHICTHRGLQEQSARSDQSCLDGHISMGRTHLRCQAEPCRADRACLVPITGRQTVGRAPSIADAFVNWPVSSTSAPPSSTPNCSGGNPSVWSYLSPSSQSQHILLFSRAIQEFTGGCNSSSG